ncbi:MAG: peptidylprolyl isomerase [Polyangiaceae bacterium]|nr:peptidylprolyl isomerase [Polyangiaceae bacterium]MCW5792088.1 peptidylprolyl isomerase [Polyangiaceae bacterium]
MKPLSAEQRLALTLAEQRRDTGAVPMSALESPDVATRVAATRALARIADASAHTLLLAQLRDPHPEVLGWAAYGVGESCAGREYAAVRALATRAASLSLAVESTAKPPTPNPPTGGKPAPASAPSQPAQNKQADHRVEPWPALAGALARCGGAEAEATLKAWLRSDIPGLRAEAALSLTRLAARTRELQADTQVKLLERAAAQPPLEVALAPFAHLTPSAAVAKRVREVASTVLDAGGGGYAVQALVRCGPEAAGELHRVALDPKRPMNARLLAARGLGELAGPGQEALRDALSQLASTPAQVTEALTGPSFVLILELVRALAPPRAAGEAALARLAELPMPEAQPAKRRAEMLRCAAASRVANTRSLHPALLACAPAGSLTQARAVLEVLDRAPLERARNARWLELTESKDRRVRQAAIDLLRTHPEARGQVNVLTAALAAKEPGTVAVAAQVLASDPARASDDEAEQPGLAASPALVKALNAALDRKRDPSEVETIASLIDATAALKLTDRAAAIAPYCEHPNPMLRARAAAALAALGDRRARCDRSSDARSVSALPSAKVTIELSLEGARTLSLTLDPALAPVAVQHVTELVKRGFYDGVALHRVVPGFVVQFGDPHGDGYGGAEGEPLRCETSPLPFGVLGVGLALSGRDTATGQLFVTLGEFPRLDGAYPLIGRAHGDWLSLTEGELILKARAK